MPNERENSKTHNTCVGILGTVALIAVMLIAIFLASHFLLLPMQEKQRMLSLQDELLASIETGDGVISVNSEELIVSSFGDGWYINAPVNETLDVYLPSEGSGLYSEPYNYPLSTANYPLNGIGILSIDCIDLTLPVTDGVTEAQLKIAVGHVPQTAPIGETGNAVIAGHRSYTYGQYFNRLGELSVGDIIRYRSIGDVSMEFEVYEILEILPGDPAAFEQPEDKQVLTLYTCTPIKTATHRLLVRAERIF